MVIEVVDKMKKQALRKDFYMEIRNSLGRFLSIFFIVALGVAFFTGIRSTQPNMKLSANQMYQDANLMDIQVMSTLGLTEEDIEALSEVDGVDEAIGVYSTDLLLTNLENQYVVKVHSLSDSLNKIILREGRLPQYKNECLVDAQFLENTGYRIGDKITLSSGTQEDIGEVLEGSEYTIVGSGISSLYLSMNKGTSSIGNGSVSNFIILPKEAFAYDAYTEIAITIDKNNDMMAYSPRYEELVEEVIDRIDAEVKEERIEARYHGIYTEALEEITEGEEELEQAIQDAELELKKGKKELDDAREKLDAGQKEIEEKEVELQKGWVTYYDSIQKLEDGEKKLKQGKIELENSRIELEQGKKELESLLQGTPNLEDRNQIDTEKQQIADYTVNLEGQNNGEENIGSANIPAQLEEMKTKLEQGEIELEAGMTAYNQSVQELKANKLKLAQVKKELEEGQAKLKEGKEDIEKGEKEYKEGLEEYQKGKKEADEEIADAQEEIRNAKAELNKLKKPQWYILDRNSIESYRGYGQDADRIGAIGTVFPMIFFLVAALVSLTTMTRMVEEERTQIGTLKALGYGRFAIASKYIVYALLATLGGSILGSAVGSKLLPYFIITAYQMMYVNLISIMIPYNMYYFIIATFIAVACVVFATWLACYKELTATPAILMRPASPKLGKRVFLERITFLWNRLNFTGKSTVRNLVRYKKRFFMTVFGIGGCMSLLLVGFGIKDSIFSVVGKQFGEIHIYDGVLTLDSLEEEETLHEAIEYIRNHPQIDEIMPVQEGFITVSAGNESKEAYLTVPEELVGLENYYQLKSRMKNESYSLSSDGVIITEKLGKLLDVAVGDKIEIEKGEDKIVEVTIEAISENYVMNYVFMSSELYKELYGVEPEYNEILYIAPQIILAEEDGFTQEMLEQAGIVGSTFLRNMSYEFADTLENMDVVILILILSAGGLAFIVLYNLNNINISERKRELATLKVLGFYDMEVSEYVFRENVLLTVIGSMAGIVMGFLLHRYIIVSVEIDMVMFGREIELSSYIKGVLLTMLFSAIVNLAMHYKLKRIDMATSLKSIE